jgi:polyphosphate kinase
MDQIARGIDTPGDDGQSAEAQLAVVHEATLRQVLAQTECWNQLQPLLKHKGIVILPPDELSHKDIAWLSAHFLDNIFPALTPIAIDPAHPFPFLPNLSMALIFQLAHHHDKEHHTAIVPLPVSLPRFVRLPGKKMRLLALEDIITLFLDALFPGFHAQDRALFRIVRDSELDVSDDAEDFVRHFEQAVKERRRGRVIRVRFAAPASKALVQFVTEQLHVPAQFVLELEGTLGLRSVREIYEMGDAALKYKPFKVRSPERIADFGGDCFAAIAAKDIVIHHPFETFDVVVQFLRQAAGDPNVVPIVRALIEAAEAGKAVTALVELKARFDEEANIHFARSLEAVGVQVVYGFVSLKTHAKVTLVTRREESGLKSYVHFGTGNYHPATARVYTDLSFFTCEADLCRDAAYVFNFITGYAPPRHFRKLIVAPKHLRKTLLAQIDEEIAHAKAGRPATIWAKMNSLTDPAVIDALYEAARHGVVIELVVRGICCLRPGVPGLSERIRVKSVVGRFLEHARVYAFGNGYEMPSAHAKLYIGSADWMRRNFDARVEVMVPIENPTVHEQILGQIMMANLKDETNSWLMQPDGTYARVHAGEDAFSAHAYFIDNPSLSGRGTALKKMKSSQMLRYKPAKKAG